MKSETGTFTTKLVSDLYLAMRLPPAANLSSTLGRLKAQGLLMRPSNQTWALTPIGEHKLMSEVGQLAHFEFAGSIPGSEFGHRQHALIPPFLGPIGASGLERVLSIGPFESNVMLITRFPKGPQDHLDDLIPGIRAAVADHGLTLQVASDRMVEDTLWANVVTYMWACKYAIVLIDNANGMLNSNVLIEIGGMLMTGRRCCILRDKTVPVMPSDLVGHIYKETDLTDSAGTLAQIHRWIRDDLAISTCDVCPSTS